MRSNIKRRSKILFRTHYTPVLPSARIKAFHYLLQRNFRICKHFYRTLYITTVGSIMKSNVELHKSKFKNAVRNPLFIKSLIYSSLNVFCKVQFPVLVQYPRKRYHNPYNSFFPESLDICRE